MVGCFHYLVRGVILHEDNVLVARQLGSSNTFLPGGHIEFGESAKTALAREVLEETGLTIQVGEFIGAVEASWLDVDKLNAEVNLLFKAFLQHPEEVTFVNSREPHLEFLWVRTSEVDSYNLLPLSMRKMVASGPEFPTAFWGSDLD